MTSKASTKIGWRAATGGPLAWALRRCDEREEASKDQDDEEQANLGTREVSQTIIELIFRQSRPIFADKGTESQTLEAKSAADSQGQMGSTMMLSVGFFVFERPEIFSRMIFFFPLKFQTQNPMRKRKATLGIESGPFPFGLLYRRVMTALGTWILSWLQISTKLPCRWSQWWRRRAGPEERIERISRRNIESPTDTPAASVSCSSSEGCR